MSHVSANGYVFDLALSPHNAQTRIVDAAHGIVRCDPPRKKVVITAFGPSANALPAYHENPEWEIWGLNDAYNFRWLRHQDATHALRVDRWFEIHQMHAQPERDLAWLSICPVPVYLAALDARVPNGVRYPIEAVEAFLKMPVPFWACSFSYEIALALYEGFEEIALVGFDFATPREWMFERGNVLFYAGLATGMGRTLIVPPHSTFLQHPYRYGLDYTAEKEWCEQRLETIVGWWNGRTD